MSDAWGCFTRDPRRLEHASLRASDADREVVHRVLAESYADGRLDQIVARERHRLEKRQRRELDAHPDGEEP